MRWYTGQSLLDILESLHHQQINSNAPTLMTIHDKYKVMGNTVVLGKIMSGRIQTDDELLVQPGHKLVEIVSIENNEQKVETVEVGEQVKISIRGINDTNIKQGQYHFEAQFMIKECSDMITAGFQCIVHVMAAFEEAIITV
ncbi:MAG: putative Eukaryotic peptide chain release factor GTP-binding subunit [Streblomastix strix]|uniref:Putative Eukaryotic peptide chain release factor GTP-binding subunit n=1 Tax=Streblomastix strix TaxID=222440 RepID=A0A5J4VZG9_9EUKA|nr:MAG: putative Eukaryotic peptide chain release factor GTP-binding subunit [Streblomastix strix]